MYKSNIKQPKYLTYPRCTEERHHDIYGINMVNDNTYYSFETCREEPANPFHRHNFTNLYYLWDRNTMNKPIKNSHKDLIKKLMQRSLTVRNKQRNEAGLLAASEVERLLRKDYGDKWVYQLRMLRDSGHIKQVSCSVYMLNPEHLILRYVYEAETQSLLRECFNRPMGKVSKRDFDGLEKLHPHYYIDGDHEGAPLKVDLPSIKTVYGRRWQRRLAGLLTSKALTQVTPTVYQVGEQYAEDYHYRSHMENTA